MCTEDEVAGETTVSGREQELCPPRSCRRLSSSSAAAAVVVVRVRIDNVTWTEMFLDDGWFISGCCSVFSTVSADVPASAESAFLAEGSSVAEPTPAAAVDVSLTASATFDVVALPPLSRPDEPSDDRALTSDGLTIIRLRYHSRLSSNRSRIS